MSGEDAQAGQHPTNQAWSKKARRCHGDRGERDQDEKYLSASHLGCRDESERYDTARMAATELKAAARHVLSDRRVRRIKANRLKLLELLPGVPNPTTGLEGLDRKVIPLLSAASPTFLEFGANDGLQQSNTYVLERDHGWRGILVEPLVELAAECSRNRPRATVICGAVGRPDDVGRLMEFDDQDLMTSQGAASTVPSP